ncbi:MAG: PTS sugar transporter subunit IIA [Pseudomonadota bacterium]
MRADLAACQAPLPSRKRALQHAASLLADQTQSEDTIFDAFMARERLGSTGLGNGVAIPHCRLAVPEIRVAILTLAAPVDYESIDADPVDLLFCIVVPLEEQEAHLKLLAQLSGVFSEEVHRSRLRACQNVDDLAATMDELLKLQQIDAA